ncbi:MAG: hypothetical protein ONB42_21780 [candidate division KSB1 bacterium]|nr:hypothetical protein [candidate division KSB1 bacterium]
MSVKPFVLKMGARNLKFLEQLCETLTATTARINRRHQSNHVSSNITIKTKLWLKSSAKGSAHLQTNNAFHLVGKVERSQMQLKTPTSPIQNSQRR